jgi:hypothetical protein
MLAARIFSKAILGFVLLGVSLTLGACETPPSQNVYPPLRYSHLPPLKFAVAAVEIEVAYVPSTAPPNVEVLFPVRPSEAAVNWAEDRLVATGSQRRLRYVVKEASVTETPLEVQGGITGAVTTEQSERYDARLVIEAQILDDTGRVEGTASARAVRSITVPEDASLNERERTWYELTEKLMNDMNTQLEETLRQVFFRYLEI